MNSVKLIANRCIRLTGNIFKILSYPFHFVLPKYRFTIPEHSKAKVNWANTGDVPRHIWQTNYSNRCALPVYLNYLFNRLMSLDYEYHYVSTEAREEFMKNHAPEHVYNAFMKLNDGAAQADLWRLVVLNQQGGIYMDIDATFVWPLRKTLANVKDALYIKIKKDTEFTNFFLASAPNNEHFTAAIETIVNNINHHDGTKGVYSVTGPDILNQVLKGKQVNSGRRRHICIQGTFTNEYFQYLDKPKGKWTHKDPKDLIKK